ncbi:hypothetical protein PVA38_11580 [Streptococcus pneumoniae D39]|nr:hypothetical protein PVA38_11580 [Streptococcus pneumoniae D39]
MSEIVEMSKKISDLNDKKEFHKKNCELRFQDSVLAVSYTHLRAHETVLDLVCRLLLEKKKKKDKKKTITNENMYNIL